MKAIQDFEIIVDSGGVRVPYKEGDSFAGLTKIKVKKGQEVPKEFLKAVIEFNLDYLDVVYEDKKPILPKGWEKSVPVVSKKMKIHKRKYSQESLTKIKNEQGFAALKKIGLEFGVTDRSSARLTTEILAVQEERQRSR